jgi:hypothetical protein
MAGPHYTAMKCSPVVITSSLCSFISVWTKLQTDLPLYQIFKNLINYLPANVQLIPHQFQKLFSPTVQDFEQVTVAHSLGISKVLTNVRASYKPFKDMCTRHSFTSMNTFKNFMCFCHYPPPPSPKKFTAP